MCVCVYFCQDIKNRYKYYTRVIEFQSSLGRVERILNKLVGFISGCWAWILYPNGKSFKIVSSVSYSSEEWAISICYLGVGSHSISALAPFLEGFVNKSRVGDGFPSLGIQLLTRIGTTFWASPLQKVPMSSPCGPNYPKSMTQHQGALVSPT